MIAVDTNILVYAHRVDADRHVAAHQCLTALAEGRAPWAIPWPCLHEFVGVVTHRRVFRPPTPLGVALEQVSAWMESPSLVVLSESAGYWPTLVEVANGGRVAGPLVHDARIAALCLSHGVRELWTADRDFARFPGLATRNPLSPDGVRERETTYRLGSSVRLRRPRAVRR